MSFLISCFLFSLLTVPVFAFRTITVSTTLHRRFRLRWLSSHWQTGGWYQQKGKKSVDQRAPQIEYEGIKSLRSLDMKNCLVTGGLSSLVESDNKFLGIILMPNRGSYLQLMSVKDFCIQTITVSEQGNHSNSFQVNFQTFLHIIELRRIGEVRVENQRFINWDHYKFTSWQSPSNFIVFCASSACGVSVEHMNAKKLMVRSIYRFHVCYHIRRIYKILEIPLPYDNSFNRYNNPYNHESL